MSGPPSTSVILSTVRWTGACDEVADQLGPDDELLIVADDESDPVADSAEISLTPRSPPDSCAGRSARG